MDTFVRWLLLFAREKKYESLLSREEWTKATEKGLYFQVPMDDRDLNYENYFVEGAINVREHDYNSDNTYRLSKSEVITKLKELDFIQKELER